jgi:hypothetical protein
MTGKDDGLVKSPFVPLLAEFLTFDEGIKDDGWHKSGFDI